LTELAIQNSSEIEAIEQRLELASDRIGYAQARQWTEYLTLDPLRLVQNLLGGGDVQRNRLAIAELEVRAADLVRRREEVAESLARKVVELVLEHEQLGRQIELLDSQLLTQQQRQAVMEVAYRTGQGSTQTMLSVWQRTEDLEARQLEVQIFQTQTQQELEVIVGQDPSGGDDLGVAAD